MQEREKSHSMWKKLKWLKRLPTRRGKILSLGFEFRVEIQAQWFVLVKSHHVENLRGWYSLYHMPDL